MESARSTWTDERLDDLSRVVEDGFKRVDEDLRLLSSRIDAQGAELGARIDAQGAALGARIDAQGAALGERMETLERRVDAQGRDLAGQIGALQRLMIQTSVTMMALVLVTLLSVLLTQL